jgi:SAM-dependent methyltransferase
VPRIDNHRFYTTALERHGYTAGGVHWNSEQTQKKRFEVIASLLPGQLDDFTIIDAGCGFGDFFCFLEEQNRSPKAYLGLDCMKPMVEEAQKRTGCEIRRCNILHDPLDAADYYVCSGAMNILERFETHLFITRCFEHSKKGFVFNLLEGRDDSMVYNYFRPDAMRALGQELGAEVKIRRGYLERDFTVAFYKREGARGKGEEV